MNTNARNMNAKDDTPNGIEGQSALNHETGELSLEEEANSMEDAGTETENPEEDPYITSLYQMAEQIPNGEDLVKTIMSIVEEDSEDGGDEIDIYEMEGQEYALMSVIDIADNTYVYLTSVVNASDFRILRHVVEDGEEYLINLDSENEFYVAAMYYTRKFMDKIKEIGDSMGN